MRKASAIVTMLIALAIITATTALADSGQYTAASGESCSWFGGGSLYEVSCSGYNRAAGGYVSYSCSISTYGSMGYSYSCRDYLGNSWSGQR